MLTLFDTSRLTSYLGVSDVESVGLAAQVQLLFEKQCGRERAPFKAAQLARVERLDGTGGSSCWLDYPITTLTTVKLGYDPAIPIETLSVSDPAVLVWQAAGRRVSRVDGGVFGRHAAPLYVQVTYDAAADLPEDAALAVLRVTASIFRQRGSEDVSNERMGGYGADLMAVADADPAWQMAIENNWRAPL